MIRDIPRGVLRVVGDGDEGEEGLALIGGLVCIL